MFISDIMWYLFILLIPLIQADMPAASPTAADVLAQSIDGKTIHEFRGYFKREHSLIRPYTGLLPFPILT